MPKSGPKAYLFNSQYKIAKAKIANANDSHFHAIPVTPFQSFERIAL
jgi:hypothetical protein